MEETKKYQRPQLEVICFNCEETFLKDGSEIRRNKKIGRKNYCSIKCSGKVNSKHLKSDVKHLKGHQGNRRDKYTIIREHLTRVRRRNKSYDITLDDLLSKWNEQDGICVYTGVKLKGPRESKECKDYYKASLDRIDSSLGYIVGNIQFISVTANYAKSSMSHSDMLAFCKLIKNNLLIG